jgi:hypothetical protein
MILLALYILSVFGAVAGSYKMYIAPWLKCWESISIVDILNITGIIVMCLFPVFNTVISMVFFDIYKHDVKLSLSKFVIYTRK